MAFYNYFHKKVEEGTSGKIGLVIERVVMWHFIMVLRVPVLLLVHPSLPLRLEFGFYLVLPLTIY